MSSRARRRCSARPRRSRWPATWTPTPTRWAPCSGSRRSCGHAGPTTVCSFPNEPLKLPRWASFLPGSDDLVEVADYPDAPAVMVTCDCASFDRLGPLGGCGVERRRGHLDRPSPLERRAGDDPADRPRRIVHLRDGVPADRGDGRRHAGRDRGLPVRRSRDRHGPIPVRGDHAGDAPCRRRAPRASVRSRAHGAGVVRGQPPRVPACRGGRAGTGDGRCRTPTSCGRT